MSNVTTIVESHYGTGGLMGRLDSSLAEIGTTIQGATTEQIASIDQFHACGLAATREMIALSGFGKGMTILDVGSGIGGPARCLAEMAGCQVTGVDLTEEYIEAARSITKQRGLASSVSFVHGSALSTPFESGSFDGAWMQHMNMNIEDKPYLVREVFRVLKPGSKLALHEFFSVGKGVPHFPVPWATTAEGSFLVDPAVFKGYLRESGFEIQVWNDLTGETIDFLRGIFERIAVEGPPKLGPGVLLGPRFGEMAKNLLLSIEEKRVCVFMAIASKK